MAKRNIKSAAKATAPSKSDTDTETDTKVKAKPKRQTSAQVQHDIATKYAGPSKGLNSRKSKTPIDHKLFGTDKGLVLRERSIETLKPLKDKYGSNPWPRGNLDAGILKFGIKKGIVQPVEGRGDSESDTYKFVGDVS